MPLISSLGVISGRSLGLGNSNARDPHFDKLSFTLPSLTITTDANTAAFIDSGTANTGNTGFTVNRFGNTHMGSYSPFNKRGNPDDKRWSYEFDNGQIIFPVGVLNDFVGWNGRKNTIECWIKPKIYNTGSLNSVIIGSYEATEANGRWVFGLTRAGNVSFVYTTSISSENTIATTSTVELQKWTHVCIEVDGTTSTAVIYINGVGQKFTGLALSTQGTTHKVIYGIARSLFGGYHNGQLGLISNLRWVNSLVYNNNFTPPSEPLKRIDGTLLLTLQDGLPLDRSANNYTLDPSTFVRVLSSSPFPVVRPIYDKNYEGGSAYFDGTGDYLTVPDDAALEIGSSEFGLDIIFNPSATTAATLFGKRANASGFAPLLVLYTASSTVTVYMSTNGTTWDFVNAVSLGTAYEGSWNHVSVFRVGNDWYGSLNGTITTLKSATSGTLINNTANYHIGADTNPSNSLNGYIAAVRLVIGSSPYTSTSAPIPTEPLSNITDTKLLLKMDNFNYYDPTRQHTLEIIGSVPLVASPSKWGNSVLSLSRTSGSINTILVPSRASLNLNRDSSYRNDFTIEFWIYPTSLNVTDGIIAQKDGVQSANFSQWKVALTSANTGNVVFSLGNPSGSISKQDVTSNVAVTINNWNHVACQRVSNNYVIYVNGTLAANAVISVNLGANSRPMYINGQQNGLSTSGVDAYLDGLRIVRGVSVYSGATATIPQGPFGNQ